MQSTAATSQYEGQVNGDLWEFPAVKSINAHGKETSWQIIVKGHGEKCNPPAVFSVETLLENRPLPAGYYATIKVNSGLTGGLIKNSPPTMVTAGKNLGKKNETNVFCQAMNEARGKYEKQLRGAATPIVIHGVNAYPPMLAQEIGTKVTFPVFLQYKYDGLRAVAVLAGDRVIMYTRTRVEILGLQHIKFALLPILQQYPTWYLDGEVYKHGMSLQTISGLVREETPSEEAKVLDFIVYDCFVKDDKEDYKARLARIRALNLPVSGENDDVTSGDVPTEPATEHTTKQTQQTQQTVGIVQQAKTWVVDNQGELNVLYKEALDAGYEGAIVRKNAPYELSYNNRHSKYLLKMKPEADAEFEVIAWKVGDKGKTLGAFIVVCRTDDGHTFSVNPAMPIADRVELAKTMGVIELNGKTHFENEWKGRKITVKFASLSDDKVPLQPRTNLHRRID